MVNAFFYNYTSNAKKVAILFGKNFEYKINKHITDNEGNFIIVDITAQNQRFTLVNIYGPNLDHSIFSKSYFNIQKRSETQSSSYVEILI